MPRKVKEWIGKTDDSPVPPKVRQRNYDEYKGICQISFIQIRAGDAWETHHKIPLWKGGENRESNLVPVLKKYHDALSAEDKTEKKISDRKRQKHLGIKKRGTRPMMGTKASGWRKRMNGTVEKR